MSFSRFRPWTAALSTTLLLSLVSQSHAQLFRNGLFGNGCNTCASAQPVSYAPPQMAYDPCNICTQQRTVYRQVPVTEHRQVTQRVRKPVVETAYEDREYTEYKTVYETVSREVPTVSYQNVTEYHTVQRDMGRWVSQQRPVNKVSPCEYDSTPGLFGVLNRTRQSLRNLVTPSHVTQRQYCPNVVAQQVPVTRQVAIRGTKTVNYQVARLVPEKKTRQVAVRKIRWEEEEVTASVPVTTYRTVPVGTQTAYGFVPFENDGGTTTAQGPSPDPISSRKAEGPTPAEDRTAEGKKKDDDQKKDAKKTSEGSPFGSKSNNPHEVQPASYRQTVTTNHSPASSAKPAAPSMIRSNGWRARATQSETPSPSSGSSDGPALQVVKTTN